jgi:hypothetical protein
MVSETGFNGRGALRATHDEDLSVVLYVRVPVRRVELTVGESTGTDNLN